MSAHWSQKEIVYQIYPRSFCDFDGDGIGDIPGIVSRLDYLKSLGVGVIWLSPVYRSPNDDNGYDISDYFDINPEFGTMADMDALIREATSRGIRIIMDLVINHTSDEHKWFQESIDPQSPYHSWYFWRDGKSGGKRPPNNWSSFFGGGAWSKSEQNGKYYLHLFSKKQPDLDFHNPDLVEKIKSVLTFWLDKGIAGFRCDVINVCYKSSLANGKPHTVLVGREHYLSQAGCHDLLKKFREEVFSQYDCFTVGETVMVTPQTARDLCAKERKELDMVFEFQRMETDQVGNKWFKTKFRPSKLMRTLAKWQSELEWNTLYLENHDQPRSVSRFGSDKAFHYASSTMLAAVYMLMKGTAFVYQGQEIGMTNGDFTSMEDFRDVETLNVDKIAKKLLFSKKRRWKMLKATSRDNARTPMQWDGSQNGGFTKGVPWLKVNDNSVEINVEHESKDANTTLNFYKRLIALKTGEAALIEGKFSMEYAKNNVFVYARTLDGVRYFVIANWKAKKAKMPLDIGGEIVLSNYNRSVLPDMLSEYETVVLKKISDPT